MVLLRNSPLTPTPFCPQHSLKESAKTIKSTMKQVNLDKLETLQDDLTDLMYDAEEVQEVMGRALGFGKSIWFYSLSCSPLRFLTLDSHTRTHMHVHTHTQTDEDVDESELDDELAALDDLDLEDLEDDETEADYLKTSKLPSAPTDNVSASKDQYGLPAVPIAEP